MKPWNRKIMEAVWFLGLSFLLTGCGRETVKLTAVTTAMGTVVQETLYVSDEKNAKELLTKLEACLQEYETEVLSWREETSEVAWINASAGSAEGTVLTERMQEYLLKIWQVSENSNGALDVTVGQVTEVWNLDEWAMADEGALQEYEIPSQEEIEALLADTGYEKVSFFEDCIYLPKNMKLDLGAVGKGIVCDEIGKYLKEWEQVQGAVITVGGSVVTYGSKPDGSAWQVAITHPREDGAYIGTLSLEGEHYVSTSGDYERYVEKDGVRYHHILNPDTGYPADSGVCSVTIVSDSGLLSDALSTACFVLGVEEGRKLAESFGAQALFISDDLELFMTEGMEQYFAVAQ